MAHKQAKVTDFFKHRKSNESDAIKLLEKKNGPAASAASKTNAERDNVSVVPKNKLKPEDIRRLGKIRNLDELRQRLGKFSEAAARLNEEHRQAQLNAQTIEQVTSPYKASPVKDSNGNKIVEDKTSPSILETDARLEIPLKYKYLEETFRVADLIVGVMYNRTQLITFDRLKTEVQKSTRKNFEKTHLGQIKTVYPEAYRFAQQKLPSKFSDSVASRADQYYLVIEPNLETDLKTYNFDSPSKTPAKRRLDFNGSSSTTPPPSPVKFVHMEKSPVKTPSKNFQDFPVQQRKYFSAGRLNSRITVFKKNLLTALNEEHKKFLATLSPPLILTKDEESQLQRWHPEFQLNKVPDVTIAELPEPPVVEKVSTAREMLLRLDAGNGTPNGLPAKVGKALQDIITKSIESTDTKIKPESSDIRKKCLEGIPASVLAKVRAKQSAKQQKLMHFNKADEIKQQRFDRLPDIIRIIRGLFATENKNVLSYKKILDKLSTSYKSIIASDELENTLNVLLGHKSKWLTKTAIQGKEPYVRIDKTIDTNDLIQEFVNTVKK